MISSVLKKASRILPIKGIDYELPIDTCFHPAFVNAAIERVCDKFYSTKFDIDSDLHESLTYALGGALADPASHKVWAIVLEYKQNPLFVVQNLAFTRIPMHYRRVYHVNCDLLCAHTVELSTASLKERIEAADTNLQERTEAIADTIVVKLNKFLILQTVYMIAFATFVLVFGSVVFGSQEIAAGRSRR
jgi:hypothetical protein